MALALTGVALTASARQEREPIKGEAALKHPAGQLAIKAAELMTAGKLDEAFALRTKTEQSEWNKASAAERKESGALVRKQTPDPKVLAEGIRKSGELSIMGNSAVLGADLPNGRTATYYELESGTWRIANGPILFVTPAKPDHETRIEDAEILKHPIGALALQYVDLVHAGKLEEAKRMATASVQAEWKTESASARKEIADFFRSNLPTKAELLAALQSGGKLRGVLLIEDESKGTLNIIRNEQRVDGPGKTTYSTSTTAIGFAMEGGKWRLAQ